MGWFSKKDDGFFLCTVMPSPEVARVERFLGLVNGEAIIGANIFRDMFSSVRDVVGGRAGGYERALSGARDAALEDLKLAAARELGATGVIGIDPDYEVLGEANGMMMVAVSGTAVKLMSTRPAGRWRGPSARSGRPGPCRPGRRVRRPPPGRRRGAMALRTPRTAPARAPSAPRTNCAASAWRWRATISPPR
jgi:uncharacterized protein YbjQ (UPF0145 family)